MIDRPAGTNASPRLVRIALSLLALLLFIGPSSAAAATPTPRLNGAGLVIKHGDGSVLYFYVQFSEAQITGEQLLERAGVQLDMTPYAGLGGGVCMIDHEGCPSTDCFCKSFAVPSVFWRYHSLSANGSWVFRATGPGQRVVHDGDVDGWSWSSKDGDLPATSIDAIAKLNGITRTVARDNRIATPSPLATPPTETATPASTQSATRTAPTATARVAGVAVSETGQTTAIDPSASRQHQSGRTYLWFGAGIIALLLIAIVVALRRKAGATR